MSGDCAMWWIGMVTHPGSSQEVEAADKETPALKKKRFSTGEACGKAEPSSNLRMKAMPNFNAIWAIVGFALQKPKKIKKTTKNNTCLDKNDKCQLLIYICFCFFFTYKIHWEFFIIFLKKSLWLCFLVFSSRSTCSRDLSGQCSGKSFDQLWRSRKQCATHAWCTLGVIVRCFIRDIRQNPVWSCIELWSYTAFFNFFFQILIYFLSHQNCSCREIQTQDPVSPFAVLPGGTSRQFLSVHRCLSDSGVWNAILLCM